MNDKKNISGGNTMTLSMSARRLGLLSSASLLAIGALSVAVALTPVAAKAAPNPCGVDPAANGAAADTIVCPVDTYPTGIEHTAVGDILVTVQTGTNFGTGGVVTTAGGAGDPDNVTVRQTGGNMNLNSQAFPVFIDAASQTGDIDITAEGQILANNAATLRGIRAVSEAGGDVTINIADGVVALRHPDSAGIEARSIGGGDVTINSVREDRGGIGQLYGMLVSTDGAGAVTINASADTSGGVGIAAIRAIAETGPVSITGDAHTGASSASPDQSANYGVWVTSGGDVQYTGRAIGKISGLLIDADGDITVTGQASGGQFGIDLVTASGTSSVLNLTPQSTGVGSRITEGGLAAIRASGGGRLDVNVAGELRGSLDFSGLSTRPTIDILSGGIWSLPTSANVQSTAGVSVSVAEGGLVRTGAQTNAAVDPTVTVSFSGADDTFNLSGALAINRTTGSSTPNFAPLASETVLEGLETFRNAGSIYLGQHIGDGDLYLTDNASDDILTFQGTDYIGEGGRLVMDVNLTGASQSACSVALRDEDSGALPAADCVRIVDGSTSGTTYVTVNQIFPFDRGAFIEDGIVLVDLENGDSAQGHFVVDPASQNYSELAGGGIDKGVFFYAIAYDEAETQHKLVSLASGNALQFPVLATAAQSVWRTSTGTWLDRQADLRSSFERGVGGGIWLRGSVDFSERDLLQSSMAAGQTFTFDNTLTQNAHAITGGVDLVTAVSDDSAFVLGVMGGYAHSDVEYEASPNTAEFNGWTGGVYASYIASGFFVDAAVNANKLVMDDDVPAFNFFPAGTILSTDLLSLGAQIDAGWRFPVMTTAFIEPLASLSYVKTFYDDIEILADDIARDSSIVEFRDPSSLRAGLGLRAGLDHRIGALRTQYSVLGRIWEETVNGNEVLVYSGDHVIPLLDAFSGRFSEFAVGASLWAPGGALSGFFNFGGKFGDDYKAQNLSAGLRVNW